MNFYLLIFLSVTLIYSLNLFSNNEKSLAMKFKFSISSFLFLILAVILGFRDTLGSDYGSYFLDFTYMQDFYLENNYFVTQNLDLFYEYLSFFIIYLGLPFDYLSLLISFIFVFSIIFFSLQENDYLMIILIFLSYYYLVLGMGYIRQGLSISFLIFFIHFWRNEKIFLSWVFLIIAILTHKFAIISSFLIFVRPKDNWLYFNKYFYIFLVIVLVYLFYKIFESKNIIEYFNIYSLEKSSGAFYRTLGGAICAILFFSKKSFFKKRSDYRYLYISSTILMFLFPASFVYSTISDRLLAYFLPCMFIILSTISITFKTVKPSLIKFFLITILFSHLLFWTNFSKQSNLYVPYRMIDYPGSKESPYKYMIRYCC